MRTLPSLPRVARRPAALCLLLLALGDLLWTTILLPRATHARERTISALPTSGGAAIVLACTYFQAPDEPERLLEGRLQTALDLYQAGKVGWLLVSGDDRESVIMRRWLEERGVPPGAIASDSSSHRTYESLQHAKATFGLSEVVVVTSDFHLPRALWLSAHLGLAAVGVEASTARYPPRTRADLLLREYAARNRAILDMWFHP